jgi:serine/threonine protein kinase
VSECACDLVYVSDAHTLSPLASARLLTGQGAFGLVKQGEYMQESGIVKPVAVKMLKTGASEHDKELFLREAALMQHFVHPNVVSGLGCVPHGEPVLIVMEFLDRGSLFSVRGVCVCVCVCVCM